MKRRLAEIWRRRNEKVGQEKEERERAMGWSKKKEKREKKHFLKRRGERKI